MSDDEDLRRLLGELAGDPPIALGRKEAVYARIAREGRRRTAVRSAGAAVAVVVLALGAVTVGGALRGSPDREPDRLGSEVETAAPSTSPTATPTPTAGPSVGPSASRSPAPPALTIAGTKPGLLLGGSFVQAAFGAGRSPGTQGYADGQLPGTAFFFCAATAPPKHTTGRSWSWPAEVVVTEFLLEYPSSETAREHLDQCGGAEAASPQSQAIDERLEIADGGFLVQERFELFRVMRAGARVGRFLVLVEWRQSGAVPSVEPLTRALEAAVAEATLTSAPSPLAAAPQQPREELRGYVSRGAFPNGFGATAHVLDWAGDRRDQRAEIPCEGTTLPTTESPVRRQWASTGRTASDHGTVNEWIATAPSPVAAQTDFDACRRQWLYPVTPIEDLGDEAYLVRNDAPEFSAVYVRSGSTYLVLDALATPELDLEALARTAFVSWQEAQP